jgi:uncharacterized membrane protein
MNKDESTEYEPGIQHMITLLLHSFSYLQQNTIALAFTFFTLGDSASCPLHTVLAYWLKATLNQLTPSAFGFHYPYNLVPSPTLILP